MTDATSTSTPVQTYTPSEWIDKRVWRDRKEAEERERAERELAGRTAQRGEEVVREIHARMEDGADPWADCTPDPRGFAHVIATLYDVKRLAEYVIGRFPGWTIRLENGPVEGAMTLYFADPRKAAQR